MSLNQRMIKANEKQREAIEAKGSIVVRAGAGTGKTQMLAGRFVHEVIANKLSPLEIVAVTYTEKAAAELRARVRMLMLQHGSPQLAAEADAAMIGTIHSLAAHICREFGELIDLPTDFAILDKSESDILLAGIIDEAMFRIDPQIIERIGYTRLRGFLKHLAEDPLASSKALSYDEDHYNNLLKQEKEKEFANLIASKAWNEARDLLPIYRGAEGDKLEEQRRVALDIIKDAESQGRLDIELVNSFTKGFRSNLGSKNNWQPEELENVRKILSALKEELKTAIEIIDLVIGPAEEQMFEESKLVKQAFEEFTKYYRQRKLQLGVMDFADLEIRSLELLEKIPVRDHYALRWKAILVDEYQDTNPTQEKILNHLAMSGARLTIVGDEKQSIYAFRGADPRVFERALEKIGNSVSLDESFRSHARLVENTNSIFRPILGRISQDLTSKRYSNNLKAPFIRTIIPNNEDEADVGSPTAEATLISEEIAQILNNNVEIFDSAAGKMRPAEPRDIVVLSRNWKPLNLIARKIRETGISAVTPGGEGLLETREAKDALSVLEFAIDPTNDIALAALLRSPMFCIDDRKLYAFAANLPKESSWWENLREGEDVFKAAHCVLSQITPGRAATFSAVDILRLIDKLTGYSAIIANLEDGDRRLADWRAMQSLLFRIAGFGYVDAIGAVRYLRELFLAEVKINRPLIEAGNAVQLMTIHAAKGLEWPVVFVSGLGLRKNSDDKSIWYDADCGVAFKVSMADQNGSTEDNEPSILKILKLRNTRLQSEENRRLLYVAATRARDYLYFTTDNTKGELFKLLLSGLVNAEMTPENRFPNPVLLNRTGKKEESKPIYQIRTESIPRTLPVLPVTGLTDFAICPRRFEYRALLGNPGLPEGPGGKMAFGKLVHLALETECKTEEELSKFAPHALPDELSEAIRLANIFRTAACYAEFNRRSHLREVEMSMSFDGVLLKGRADLVGDDFVLDFKTGESRDASIYRFQIWAYARYFQKPKAAIAFLSHQTVETFDSDNLSEIENEARELISAVKSGRYIATPDAVKCQSCFYVRACPDAAEK